MDVPKYLLIVWITVVFCSSCLQFKSVPDEDTVPVDGDEDDDEEDIWLGDRVNYYYDYMGDAPDTTREVRREPECPPFPEITLSVEDEINCNKNVCSENTDCDNEKICCYNGCINVCTQPPEMPIFIDWIREPRKRLSSGGSWLMNDPESTKELEPCSTTPYSEEEDPLLCPHGYVCHVVIPGEPNKGVPNRGHCIPESEEELARLGLAVVSQDGDEGSCSFNKYVLLNGAKIKLLGLRCTCKEGNLVCREQKNKKSKKGAKKKGRKKKQKRGKQSKP